MLRILTAVVLVGLLAGTGQTGETKYGLNGDNTQITFVGAKPQGKHDGGFKKLTGTATINGSDATSLKFTVEIDMNSMWTDTEKLTTHLKSADFFNVKINPKAKFISSKVEKSGDDYKVTGKLTMAGKTKDLTFPARIQVSGSSLILLSDFTINRNDWGISYGKGKIYDDVKLKVALKATK